MLKNICGVYKDGEFEKFATDIVGPVNNYVLKEIVAFEKKSHNWLKKRFEIILSVVRNVFLFNLICLVDKKNTKKSTASCETR